MSQWRRGSLVAQHYQKVTGQAAKTDGSIAIWQANMRQRSDRIRKNAESRQKPEIFKQKIAAMLPVTLNDIEVEMQRADLPVNLK